MEYAARNSLKTVYFDDGLDHLSDFYGNKDLFDEYGNENESFKDFVYTELNGQDWDFCGTDENEVID